MIFEVLKKYVKKKKLTENEKTLNQIHKFIDKKIKYYQVKDI